MPSFVISGLISLVVLLLTSIAGVLNEHAESPKDTGIAGALNAFALSLQALASQAASIEGGGHTEGTGEHQAGQGAPTFAPTPIPGERYEALASRWPAGLPCPGQPGTRFDPWYPISTPEGFTRGAWIPVDAPYTLPVND